MGQHVSFNLFNLVLMRIRVLFFISAFILTVACSNNTRFQEIAPRSSGITFENTLVEDTTFNFLNYLYYYNGGGVATGDIDNDGLDDLFFTSNQNENKLYRNKGSFTFEDVTETAGIIHQPESWSTGVAMVDINGDAWLDIFVHNVNYLSRDGRNQVFINNQDGTFTDRAEEMGLATEAYSVQSAFLDYDKDGDLDIFLLNHSVHSIYSYRPIDSRERVDPKSGDKLFRNDDGVFTEVSEEAGIFSSALGFGLGVTVSDFNKDGWPDIYVGNDFHEDDYLYINQKNGTFTESIREAVQHTSQFTMSVDVADIDNDGEAEIATTDMLPYEEAILKRSGGGDSYQVAEIKFGYGYYPQYSRNMLQWNRGAAKSGLPIYSEIGYLAGIEATDWSWSGLLADLDNDGYRDFYIANGIYRRPNDLDYIKYISSSDIQSSLERGINPENLKLVQRMPQLKIPNAVFRNNQDLSFSNESEDWGLNAASYSNGAAYSDLDNDGDLDLIVNNVNMPAFIYENRSDELEESSKFIQFHLMGTDGNTQGIGAKIYVYAEDNVFFVEQSPVRGFQSSVSGVLHLGLGSIEQIDSLRIIWPNDNSELKTRVPINTLVHLDQQFAREKYTYGTEELPSTWFTDITETTKLRFKHTENEFIDFNNERLIPHYLSSLGPPVAVADINNDGLEDVFIGNGKWEEGEIWLQQKDATFIKKESQALFKDRFNEDTDAIFVDVNADGAVDLIVGSGGGEFIGQNRELMDRLYVNDGKGNFTRSEGLPPMFTNTSVVAAGDFDNDNDPDLFIGGLSVPGLYGLNPVSFLLQNNGNGYFVDVTDIIAPQLRNVGMVTDAEWTDLTMDGVPDLVLAGEWMPLTVFKNILPEVANADTIITIFSDVTATMGLSNTRGWWNSVHISDVNNDGFSDILAGNLGLNSYLSASVEEPVSLYLNDYNKDTKGDPVVALFKNGEELPLSMVDELFSQMTSLRRNFSTYDEYGSRLLTDWFTVEQLDSALTKRAVLFESVMALNQGGKMFEVRPLPLETQLAPTYSFYVDDVNEDGKEDVFQVGNFWGVSPFLGRYDANFGTLLLQDSKNEFEAESLANTGVVLRGEHRAISPIRLANGEKGLIVSQNDGELVILRINQK